MIHRLRGYTSPLISFIRLSILKRVGGFFRFFCKTNLGGKLVGGYTMVEILIVIAIIGVLLAVALPNIAAVRRRSQEEKMVADLGVIETALQQYRQQCRVYPKDLSGKLDITAKNGVPGVNNGNCPTGSKLSDFLPSGFTVHQDVKYFALRRPGNQGIDGRCTSYLLSVVLSSSDSVPIKRSASRGWTWADSKSNFGWVGCTNNTIINDPQTSEYVSIVPAPY